MMGEHADAEAMTSDLIANVRAGHARGWSFTPLRGKVPTLEGWQSRPRESINEALRWAASGNVGLRTGSASGVVVLDVDQPDLPAALDAIVTVRARTGGDKWHLYLLSPPGVSVPNVKLAGRIDGVRHGEAKGDGGQVVFPGSMHPDTGQLYRWDAHASPDDLELAPLPADILAALLAPPKKSEAQTVNGLAGHGRATMYGRAALVAECAAVASARPPSGDDPGERNNTLNVAALKIGHLIAGGELDEAEARGGLLHAAQVCGLPDREARATIDSGIAAGMKDPKSAPRPESKASSGGAAKPARLALVCVSTVPRVRVRWFWRDRIPAGKLTLLCGEPAGGKTFVSLDFAARTTRGAALPGTMDTANPAGSVVILAAEDDIGDTLRPRLEAAGADVSRVHVVEGVGEVGEKGLRTFNIERDVHLLDAALADLGDVRLVIVDPLSSYMGGERDSWKDPEVRAALLPLVELAKRRGVPIVGIVHLRKAAAARAMHRIIGSVAFAALARAVWFIDRNPDDPTEEERLLLCGKLTVGKRPRGWRFILKQQTPGEPAIVSWGGEVDASADDLIGTKEEGRGAGQGPKVAAAVEWLRTALAKGPRRAADIQAEADEAEISERTLDRAKRRLKVVADNSGKVGAPWTWRLPDAEGASA